MVPDNADAILQNDIAQAEANGGNFDSAFGFESESR